MGQHVKNGPQYLSRDDVDGPFRTLYHNTSVKSSISVKLRN